MNGFAGFNDNTEKKKEIRNTKLKRIYNERDDLSEYIIHVTKTPALMEMVLFKT